jgi:hypothetical protein
MRFIKEYKKFDELDLLSDKAIDSLDNEVIMSILYKHKINSGKKYFIGDPIY